jgi:hypothetical protein
VARTIGKAPRERESHRHRALEKVTVVCQQHYCLGVDGRKAWQADYEARRVRDSEFATLSGIEVDAVYGPDSGEFPGQWPYTRGLYASMYRSKLWTMRQFAGGASRSG